MRKERARRPLRDYAGSWRATNSKKRTRIKPVNRGACPYGLRREAKAPRRFLAATRQTQATHELIRRASGRRSAVAAGACRRTPQGADSWGASNSKIGSESGP
ncbi:MAG TPA: hypothetical protein DCE44_05070 [Verrucomicrobiales bacterium]|nr:hypothetical protein [Verrucomicrobiales bacterium]